MAGTYNPGSTQPFETTLNVVLLVTCICIVIVLILYLFFWNRCVGFLFGLIFRLFYWRQGESSVWLDIGSVHFSILSGRILFKDLRYHSSSQTIRVVKGQLSWRYWIRRPAEEEDLSHARVVGEDPNLKGHSPLSCRIHISLQGLEWLIYNRTAAYDSIVSQMEVDDMPTTPAPTPARGSMEDARSFRRVFSRPSLHESTVFGPPISLVSSVYRLTPGFFKRMAAAIKLQLPNFDLKNLLPVSIEATKAAIICGNTSTRNLLVASFSRAEGTYGIVQARSKYDLYKQVLNLKFHNASAHYVENTDYRAHMEDVGEKIHGHIQASRGPPLRQSSYLSYFSFEKLWTSLQLWSVTTAYQPYTHGLFACIAVLVPRPPVSFFPWRKKKEEEEEETPLGADFARFEYAIERKILEAPVLELLYYADVVGTVPVQVPQQPSSDSGGIDPFDIGNGDLPPEWGIDFVVRGGFLRYGPWADRQRVELQHTFFPQMFQNVEPASRLKTGDMRMWTGLKVFIELRDGVTLHIPFREASKNWQWDGKVEVPNRPRKREPASIHVKAGDSSTISYILPMVAGPQGYQSILEVHLDTITVTSSLNDIRLVTADSCRIRCQLLTPLKWNGERQWNFAVSLRQTSLFVLRDHVNMLTDLGKDWSAGPPGDYNRFIPMVYAFDVNLHNYEINMYVNDHNIIDKPLIREDNAMLTLRGIHFQNGVRIPFVKYRPEATMVTFWIEVPDVAVSLTLPRWNSYTLFAKPDRSDLGTIGLLRMDASYHYYAEVSEKNLDHLKLDFTGSDVIYRAFGWSLRHFMILRDNYFGSFTHFSTLYEYLEKRKRKQPLGDPVDLQYRPGNSNAMDVELAVNVERGLMALPAGFPGYEMYGPEQAQSKDNDLGACLLLNIPGLQVQLRTNDYYMDLSFNVDTMSGRIEKHFTKELLSARKDSRNFKEMFVIDGIDITANRLFGPQPHTSTYFCIWEIHVGDIKAVLSAFEGRLLSAVWSSFGSNFSDPLNAPANEYAMPMDPDVTFLNLFVDTVNVVWLVDGAAAELSLPKGLKISTNDLAGKTYRKVASIRLPYASLKALLASRKPSGTWYETTDLIADADMDIYSAPVGWKESARAQTEFLVAQDKLTGRARFCYSVDYAELAGDGLPSGRILRDSDLYLPQLRIPGRATSAQSHGRVTEHPATTKNKPPHNPLLSTPLAVQSESEGDDVLTEADRDTRLANSRPFASPQDAWHTDDDESMRSGDESDNEDLTESQGWDSDNSATSDDSPADGVWPSAAHYSVLTKHYLSYALKRPSLWDVSPFQLSRNAIPSCHRNSTRTSFHPTDGGPDSTWCRIRHHTDQEVDATIFRVLCKNGVRVWLTPLLLPVIEQLLQDLSGNQLSPELRFDAMMATFTQTTSSDPTVHGKTTSFDIHLSSIQLHSIQFVDSSNSGNFDGRDDGIKSCLHLKEGTITAVDLRLDDSHISGSITDSNPSTDTPSQRTMTSCIGDLVLSLQTEQDLVAVDSDTSIRPTCYIVFSRSRISMVDQEFTVAFDNLAAELGHTAPEVALATAAVTARFAQGLSASHRRSSTHTPALDRQIIHQVLKYSRQRPVVDPLSTIQPSYLVQKGRPDKLRKNTSFKFLVYLRVCLRYLESLERRAVVDLQPDLEFPVSLQDIISILDSQYFSHTGEDDASLSHQSLLQDLFPSAEGSPTDREVRKTDTSMMSVSFRLERMSMVLHHPDTNVQSSFSCSSLVILAYIRTIGFLHLSMLNLSKSLPNLILRDKDRLNVRHVAISMALGKVATTIFPQLMRFIQIIIRANRHYSRSVASPSIFPASASAVSTRSPEKPLSMVYLEIVLSTRSLRFTAAADKLILDFRITGVTYASTSLARPPSARDRPWSLSANHSLNFDECSLRARSGSDASKHNDDGVLASFYFKDGRTNAIVLQEPHKTMACRILLGLKTLHLNIPRSALRLYRFTEEWRADYLPGINAAMQALLSELHQGSTKPVSLSSQSSHRSRSDRSTIQVQMLLSSVKVTLQVMLGTWLSWDVTQSIVHLTSSSRPRRKRALSFGLQIGPHIFVISSRAQAADDVDPTVRIKLELPVVTLKGHYDESGMHGLALVEFFHMTLRPSDLDTLLSVQQKSGQDFYDFLHLIEETRRRKMTSNTTDQRHSGTSQKFSGSFRMKGFRVGLEGPTSTVLLECDDIGGGYESVPASSWHIKLSDLALSFASSNVRTALDRGHRSAFVTIDFQANMGSQSESSRTELLQVSVTKVHAVMHPTSLGEFGDFIDHLQAEVLIREEERAHELAAFKEKTRSIMRSLDVKSGETQDTGYSWLDKYSIKLTVRHVGVSFPLSLGRDLHMPRSGSQDNGIVPAFLFSIKSINFGTHHGDSGQATMKGFSFQFVSRFRQSVATDFSGDSHQTRNRLLYPEMTAQLRLERSAGSRRIRIGADVSGFILDFDSTMPEYIFSLIDVYRQGKDWMERLASSAPRPLTTRDATSRVEAVKAEMQHDALAASNILISLTFSSGKVLLHCPEPTDPFRSRSFSSAYDPSIGVEAFDLPVVSVWGEYRAAPAPSTVGRRTPSTLMFKSTIHSSQNTLKPALLPFITSIVDRVETRMRSVTRRNSQSTPFRLHEPLPSMTREGLAEHVIEPATGMQISLSLRIDQSKLELTCQPDVNVIAGLHWDSGGFVVNISPGARRVAFTGNVGGLTVGLKHGFLSEDCVKLDARNLVFNMTFSKMEPGTGNTTSSISVVLDTDIAGGVRFSRLQDVLCFKAVWLDCIPIFSGQSQDVLEDSPEIVSRATPSPKQEITTAVLFRFRHIKLDADLGQSISSVQLNLADVLVRTKFDQTLSELSLSVAELAVLASGNLSGQLAVPNFRFQTTRRNDGIAANATRGRMLDLSMTSGVLTVELESEYQRLIQYRAEPMEVLIYDDWSKISSEVPTDERRVDVTSSVSGTELVIIMNVGTIPRLVSYANKFKANLDAQKEGASRESKAFRIVSSPKPDNPLSSVANAMLKSTRSRLKEADGGISYTIIQRMSFKLERLRLIVFPRSMRDTELAHFIGREVHARLDRLVISNALPSQRDLHLSFSSITTSRITQLNHALVTKEKIAESQQWLSTLINGAPEATIFGLPSMDIHMHSQEIIRGITRTLSYDFSSRFVSMQGAKDADDIYITLNMSLYSWLTLLRKTFAREMEQVQAAADVRLGTTTLGQQPTGLPRKRIPDTLAISADKEVEKRLPSPDLLDSLQSRSQRSPISAQLFKSMPSPTEPLASADGRPRPSPLTLSPAAMSTVSPPSPSRHCTSPSIDTASDTISLPPPSKSLGITYEPQQRSIERLTMRQLGEATPDVMHPFFMKKAGFSLEDSLPQYVHEYATMPAEEIMKALLKLYSKQLSVDESADTKV